MVSNVDYERLSQALKRIRDAGDASPEWMKAVATHALNPAAPRPSEQPQQTEHHPV